MATKTALLWLGGKGELEEWLPHSSREGALYLHDDKQGLSVESEMVVRSEVSNSIQASGFRVLTHITSTSPKFDSKVMLSSA